MTELKVLLSRLGQSDQIKGYCAIDLAVRKALSLLLVFKQITILDDE